MASRTTVRLCTAPGVFGICIMFMYFHTKLLLLLLKARPLCCKNALICKPHNNGLSTDLQSVKAWQVARQIKLHIRAVQGWFRLPQSDTTDRCNPFLQVDHDMAMETDFFMSESYRSLALQPAPSQAVGQPGASMDPPVQKVTAFLCTCSCPDHLKP